MAERISCVRYKSTLPIILLKVDLTPSVAFKDTKLYFAREKMDMK